MTVLNRKLLGGLASRLVLCLALTVPAFSQDAAKAVPDAQIESNVLRALAGAPELSNQNIQTSVVYGTVTISGNVHDEALRTKAENLVARADGVKKVVDQLSLGDEPAPAQADNSASPSQDPNMQLQSDGTYAPGPATDHNPNQPSAQGNQPSQDNPGPPPPPARRPMYQNGQAGYGQQIYASGPPPQGGQQGGLAVTVPPGALLRVRINRGLDSNHTNPGTPFDGTVLSDVAANGMIAIPRGATVQGVVVSAKKAGALKGRGEIALQINNIQLAGKSYPMATDLWQGNGNDKSVTTVNRAVGLGAVGALFGAVAGGGVGAAVGAGVGAGLGVASSAGSASGQIIIAPEAVLVFHTSEPVALQTVSEQEMQRLSYAAGPGTAPAPRGYYRRGYWYPYPAGYYYAR